MAKFKQKIEIDVHFLQGQNQGRRNEKRARGTDFVEGHRQKFNYVKIHTLEFRGSVAFFLGQILTNHILSMASAITLDINTSQTSSIDSAQRVLLSLTKSTSKTVYIIFFILKGHFCPPCPSQQKARGAAAPPAPPPSSGIPGQNFYHQFQNV